MSHEPLTPEEEAEFRRVHFHVMGHGDGREPVPCGSCRLLATIDAARVNTVSSGNGIAHSCDNPPCINAAHLFLGTPADNMADRDAKGRTASGDRNGSRCRPDRRPRGEENARAKLSEDDVRRIRARAETGEPSSAIAPDYGMNPTTIRRIVSGRRWAHVPVGANIEEARNG